MDLNTFTQTVRNDPAWRKTPARRGEDDEHRAPGAGRHGARLLMTTLDQLLYGVRQVESGGNYSIVNGIGAVGAYQVMKANIPSWTKRALGYSMTWQQFRELQGAQDKVARVVLGGYYKKYGAAGAASMWFSGQPNPNSRASDGGNTVRQYVDKVAGASGGGSIGSGGGSTYKGTTPVTPKLDKDELASQYGLTAALINSSKELKSLFNKAVAAVVAAKFGAQPEEHEVVEDAVLHAAEVPHHQVHRPGDVQAAAGPAAMFAVNAAGRPGRSRQPDQQGQGLQLLKEAMYNKPALGWTDARIKDWLGVQGDDARRHHVGRCRRGVRQVAHAGVPQRDEVQLGLVQEAAVAIVGGKTTIETQEAQIRKARRRPGTRPSRTRSWPGQNVMDLAAPYIKSVSSLAGAA
jgi:hypothetical protein